MKVKTGRGWSAWLEILDREKSAQLGHKAIAELLHEKYGLPGWWAQSVAVGYEQARGLRVKHQKADGFEIGASRVIDADVKSVFKAWQDAEARARWLPKTAIKVKKRWRNNSSPEISLAKK